MRLYREYRAPLWYYGLIVFGMLVLGAFVMLASAGAATAAEKPHCVPDQPAKEGP